MATEDVVSGASQGAATGTAISPGWGTLIGAGIGAIGGLISGGAKAKAARRQERARKQAIQLSSPQHLQELMTTMQPLFRNIVASGLGPQFQQEVADNLARHGLTGTGIGETLRNASYAVPDVFAAQETYQGAREVQGGQVNAVLGGLPYAGNVQTNPLLEALSGGARAYFAMKQAQRTSGVPVDNKPMTPADTTTPINYNVPNNQLPPLFPEQNTYPQPAYQNTQG